MGPGKDHLIGGVAAAVAAGLIAGIAEGEPLLVALAAVFGLAASIMLAVGTIAWGVSLGVDGLARDLDDIADVLVLDDEEPAATHPAPMGSGKPGWYPDPDDETHERRWAGRAWADDQPRPRRR
jgi:hypothetical protein